MEFSCPGSSVHGDSLGKNTGVGYGALLQCIFPTQGSNPGLSHCRHNLYHLRYQGSPKDMVYLAIFLWHLWFRSLASYNFGNMGLLPPSIQFISVHSVVSDSMQSHGLQHARLACTSPTPSTHSNSCPLNQRSHPAISSYVVPFFSWLLSCPSSGSFPVSQSFASGDQSFWSLSFIISLSNEHSGLISFG